VGCTILNPLRADWDSTWKEEKDFEPFREQTEWELEGLERAYIGKYPYVYLFFVRCEEEALRRSKSCRTDDLFWPSL
jgi:hypothetical protein